MWPTGVHPIPCALQALFPQCTHTQHCFCSPQDYWSERLQVLLEQGYEYLFTKGEYIVKLLLGAIDPYFGLLVSLGMNASTNARKLLHNATFTLTLQAETRLPEGMQPLPFPSFPPLLAKLHYRY